MIPLLAALLALPTGVEGDRVLFVSDVPGGELALRVRDELLADGFDVIARDGDDVIDVIATARELGAAAVVEMHGARLDLWADLSRDGKLEHAALSAVGVDKDVIAVRTAELVRARLMSPRAATIIGPPSPLSPEPPLPIAFDGAAGVHGELASAGLPPRAAVDVDAAVIVGAGARVGIVISVPVLPARITGTVGVVDVDLTRADAVLGWRFSAVESVDVDVGVRGGVAWLHGSGRGDKGQPGHDGDLVAADVGASLRLQVSVASPLALFAEIDAGALAPTPVLGIGDERVRVGPGSAALVVGVAIAVPSFKLELDPRTAGASPARTP